MISAYRVAQVRAAEDVMFAQLPDGTLMQRAAMGLAIACAGLLTSVRGAVVGSRVVLLVGSGNNGGDALWAGSMLRARGCRVDAVCVSDSIHAEGAAALARAGGAIVSADSPDVSTVVAEADLVLDGIVGIGGRGGLREAASRLADLARGSEGILVAVDIPSGVDADSGLVADTCIEADVTVTFGCLKPGLLLAPGREASGAVVLVDIGLGDALPGVGTPYALSLEAIDVAAWVAEPGGDAYKYSRGVVGVAAGSAEYPGAALLCTGAARHANTGMVRYLDRSDGNASRVVEQFPDVVVDGTAPVDQPRATAWACGPGFVGSHADLPTVRAVLAADLPVVLDAGALQVVADSDDVRADILARCARGLPTILTPHEGEFRRIAPDVLERAEGRLEAASQAASSLGAVVVLKGAGTVVAGPSGGARIDTEGTADLGVAGSGDVLTGIIGGLVAGAWQEGTRSDTDILDVVAAAVWLHGRAGRIAADRGPVTAPDLIASVGRAILDARFGSPVNAHG